MRKLVNHRVSLLEAGPLKVLIICLSILIAEKKDEHLCCSSIELFLPISEHIAMAFPKNNDLWTEIFYVLSKIWGYRSQIVFETGFSVLGTIIECHKSIISDSVLEKCLFELNLDILEGKLEKIDPEPNEVFDCLVYVFFFLEKIILLFSEKLFFENFLLKIAEILSFTDLRLHIRIFNCLLVLSKMIILKSEEFSTRMIALSFLGKLLISTNHNRGLIKEMVSFFGSWVKERSIEREEEEILIKLLIQLSLEFKDSRELADERQSFLQSLIPGLLRRESKGDITQCLSQLGTLDSNSELLKSLLDLIKDHLKTEKPLDNPILELTLLFRGIGEKCTFRVQLLTMLKRGINDISLPFQKLLIENLLSESTISSEEYILEFEIILNSCFNLIENIEKNNEENIEMPKKTCTKMIEGVRIMNQNLNEDQINQLDEILIQFLSKILSLRANENFLSFLIIEFLLEILDLLCAKEDILFQKCSSSLLIDLSGIVLTEKEALYLCRMPITHIHPPLCILISSKDPSSYCFPYC